MATIVTRAGKGTPLTNNEVDANFTNLNNDKLEVEVNDLTTSVTWDNVPDAYITASSVIQHETALTITESQISDLRNYLTSFTETNDLSTAVTWDNVPDDYITESSVTQHESALTITESQISNLQSYLTSETSHADVLVDGDFSSAGFMKTNGNGGYSVDATTYLSNEIKDEDDMSSNSSTALATQQSIKAYVDAHTSPEVNDLTSSVTWANVPDANITQSSVTQHQGALSITESQISNLQTYLTAEANDLSAAVTWANVPNANITESSVTQHQTALSITESQISDLDTYLSNEVKDEDDMASDSATALATQQSIKAYVDSQVSSGGGAEINDLSTTVTWADVPDAYITQSSVTQHQAALSITESQISNLQSYLTTHQDISGKADLSGATFTGLLQVGQLGNGVPINAYGAANLYAGANVIGNISVSGTVDGVDISSRDGVLTTTTATADNALPKAGGEMTGNITFSGTQTVDGRDLSSDGAKLDGIGKFAFGDPSVTPVQTTSPVTIIESTVPTAGVAVGQHLTASFSFVARNTTATSKKNFAYQIQNQLKSKGTAGVSIGTGTYSSSPSQYNAWYYVSGNKTDIISPHRGKAATSSSGSNSSTVLGAYYDGANDRTYIRITKFPDYNTVYNNVEIFYSIDSFTSSNTWVTHNTSYNSRYVTVIGYSRVTEDITINDYFGKQSTATDFRIRFDNVSSVTGWDLDVWNVTGTVENAL